MCAQPNPAATKNEIQVVSAGNVPTSNYYDPKLGKIVYKTALLVNGEKNYLFETFADPAAAFDAVKKRDAAYLSFLSKKIGEPEGSLSEQNWEKYSQANGSSPEPAEQFMGDAKMTAQYGDLVSFFGVCEDENLNRKILKKVEQKNFLLKIPLVQRVSLKQLDIPMQNTKLYKAIVNA